VGLTVGVLPVGPLNAITDVSGVMVGHTTIIGGETIRTGVTPFFLTMEISFAKRFRPPYSWETASAN